MGSVSEAFQAMTASQPRISPTGGALLSADPGVGRRWPIRWMVLGAVVFGVICRLSQYAVNTSLWHDEAFVALNVLHKSFAELLGPLDWHEAAPPGFLVLEKLAVSTLGRSEYAFRLIPFLAGLAGLICFAGMARRVLGNGLEAFWAVLLLAASSKLIGQANEAKHFTLDVLWAVLLGWLAIRIWHLHAPGRSLLAWGALGAIGLWLSFASLFVFVGTSLALVPRVLRGWRWQERTAYLAANLAVLTALGFLLGPIRAQATGQLLTFWVRIGAFPDTRSLGTFASWMWRSHLGLVGFFWHNVGALLLALALLGTIRLSRTGRQPELFLLVLPVWMALAASLLHRWPFGANQHMVFAAPAVFLLIAEGTETLRSWLGRWHVSAGWLLVALVLLPGIFEAGQRIVSPSRKHELRPVIQFVQRHLEPGDQVLVFDPVAVEFYAGRDFPRSSVEAQSAARVWFISIRAGYKDYSITAKDVLDRLRARRPQLRGVEEYGAVAYLFGPERLPDRQASP